MTDAERYLAAAHAMQSGVAFEMQRDPAPTDPKHLRVGLNAAFVAQLALVRVLIDKGILTEDEYAKAQADAMEREVADYEERLSAMLGSDVHLS